MEYVSQAYFQAEGVFPVWEAAFALIVGQLFVAYFNPNVCDYQQKWLTIIGCIISYIWFILVSLNLQNALHFEKRLRCLKKWMDYDLSKESQSYFAECPPLFSPCASILSPWPSDDEKKSWSLWNVIVGKRENDTPIEALSKARRSTWFYRRVLPFILLAIWILLAGTIYELCTIIAIISIIIVVTIVLFRL